MKNATLVPGPDDDAEVPPTIRSVYVSCSDALHPLGVLVTRGLLDSGLLTCVQEHVIEQQVGSLKTGESRLTPHNPSLTDMERQSLGPAGLVAEGVVVAEHQLLASIVFKTSEIAAVANGLPTGERIRDESLHLPEGWGGARVVSVEFKPEKRPLEDHQPGLFDGPGAAGLQGHLRIVLQAVRPLSAGDVLQFDGKVPGVVADVVEDDRQPGMAVVGAALGLRLGLGPGDARTCDVSRSEVSAVAAVRARRTGPYSLITRQALGGQPVRPAHARWLRSRGLEANLAELVSLKSDDVVHRERYLQSAERTKSGKAIPAPGEPFSLWVLTAHLMALGLDVRTERCPGCVWLSLRPATDEQLLTASSGQVRKPDTLNYRTYAPEPDGLFCETVFGSQHESELRSKRFGHSVLPEPVVPYLWRAGRPSVLSRVLRLPDEDTDRLLRCEASARRPAGGGEVRLVAHDRSKDQPGAPPPPESGETDLGTGAGAIEQLLREVRDEDLPPDLAGLSGRLGGLVHRHLLVLPPDLRPIVLLESGNFATSDLNDLYRRVVNRANRLRKLIELNAPRVILLNEQRQLQLAVDQLFANRLLPAKLAVLGTNGRRLADVLAFVLSQSSGTRESKRVDFSGRARAVADWSLPAHVVRVPRKIFDVLGLSRAEPVLLADPDAELDDPGAGTFVALRPEPDDRTVLRLPPAAFDILYLSRERAPGDGDGVPTCAVHRPLGPEACAEAERLLNEPVLPDEQGREQGDANAASPSSWLEEQNTVTALAALIQAAASGAPVSLSGPHGTLIGGTGIAE